MRLYISYGRHDSQDFAKRLSSWLRLLGYDMWLDTEHGFTKRNPLKPAAETAIKESTFLIALLTPESIHADSIAREELRCALANNIPVFPVKIAGVALPHGIAILECLDMSADPGSVFTLLPALINQILEKAGTKKKPTPEPNGKTWWEPGRNSTAAEDLKNLGGRFTGRDWLFDQMKTWAGEKDSRILLINGEPGIGKSAIAARLATRMDVKGFISFSPGDPDSCRPESFVRALAFQFARVIPGYPEQIEKLSKPDMSLLMEEIFRTHIAEPLGACTARPKAGHPWILVIDGLDDAAVGGEAVISFLAESLDRLPPWIRVIATTKPDQNTLDRFRGPGIRHLNLEASSVDNMADLAEYIRIRVKDQGMQRIKDVVERIGNDAAGNFRYAKAVLDTRYIPGYHDQLKGGDPDRFCEILHSHYLRMMQCRFPDRKIFRKEIAPLLACLAVAETAVPEDLLVSAFTKNRRVVVQSHGSPEKTILGRKTENDSRSAKRMLRSFSPFIIREDNSVRIFHESFTDWLTCWEYRANPYLVSPQEGYHRLAEACLQELREKKANISEYVLFYIAWYVRCAGMEHQIPEVLANPYHVTAVDTRDHDAFLLLWAAIEKGHPLRMKTLYGPVIEDVPGFDRTFAERVAGILQDAGHHDEALKMLQALELIFTERRERDRAARVMTRQAAIFIHRGYLREAMAFLKKAAAIQRKYHDWQGYGKTLGCIGTIHHTRGDLTGAMKIFRDQETVCRENNDPAGILDALSSQAHVVRNEGDNEKARLLIAEQEGIRRGFWQSSEVARSRGIEALVWLDQGRSRMAMELLQEQEMLCEKLGDWIGVSECIGNQGFIYQAVGNLAKAQKMYKQQEKICREHGDLFGLSLALGNRGCNYLARGNIDEAMALFMEQEQVSRGIRYPRGLAVAFANQALVHHRKENHATALQHAGSALLIAKEQGDVNLIGKIKAMLEEIQAGKE